MATEATRALPSSDQESVSRRRGVIVRKASENAAVSYDWRNIGISLAIRVLSANAWLHQQTKAWPPKFIVKFQPHEWLAMDRSEGLMMKQICTAFLLGFVD